MADEIDSVVPLNECFLEEFREVSEILEVVRNIKDIVKKQVSLELSLERFTYVINQYQEQPHLLDPYLKTLLDELLKSIKNNMSDKPVIHLASKFLYSLTKTRGYKAIACILPHEVSDLHIILSLLSDEDFSANEAFECKYILLLWLSVVCIIPFDLSRFDDTSNATKLSTCDKIYLFGQDYLSCTNRCQEIAALMLARFLTRPDVGPLKLKQFITWGLTCLTYQCNSNKNISLMAGVLLAFSSLLKHGRREDMTLYAEEIFEKIEEYELAKSSNANIRKLSIKVIQRIGLAFLKPKLALWRYKRGLRSLSTNLRVDESGDCHGFEGEAADGDDFMIEVPDVIEQVIEKLLTGLKDKDTAIRWSSAKGIGRVTGRLPLVMADEVVASVLELFSFSETEDAWHGGCLSLGELGHRGLLLPGRLEEVVPIVERSLIYDERRGTWSVGSNVRDSASFICWSFARAYDENILHPFMDQLMRSLVVACLFDREVKVRRAASAALQELVGRQGDVTHGIDIITACDYFAVGNRNNCYLQLSILVSSYAGYQEPIIDHLMKCKISHWDMSIRELTGEALGRLAPRSLHFFLHSGLKFLFEACMSDDFCTRHGAILSTAHVLQALSGILEDFPERDAASSLLQKLKEKRFFRGMHGDIMQRAFCFFISKLSQSNFKPQARSLIDDWMEFLSECLHNMDSNVKSSALEAYANLLEKFSNENIIRIDDLMEECKSGLNNAIGHVRCAYSLLLGNIPMCLLHQGNHSKQAFDLLCQHSLFYPHFNSHPVDILSHIQAPQNALTVEERRDSIKALCKFCQNIGSMEDGYILSRDLQVVYEVLFISINDYTLDNRGDVGTCVREACMTALYDITHLAAQFCPAILTTEMCRRMFCYLVQQSSEKIDRTRSLAGEVFYKLLHHSPTIENIPEALLLRSIFTKNCTINWISPADTFPRFIQLLTSNVYSYHLVLGTVVSTGGITESLVKQSMTNLMKQLKAMKSDEVFKFGKILVKIFHDHPRVERVIIPMLKTLGNLLSSDCFSSVSSDYMNELATYLTKACIDEVNKSGDVKKLLASIDVLCGLLLTSNAARGTCLAQLMVFLCHKFPLVRKTCAAKLYESLMVCSNLVEESNYENISNILVETDWDLQLEVLRPIRNDLCDLLGISAPVMIKKKTKI